MVIFISHAINFKIKKSLNEKQEYFILMKRTIYKKDTTVKNLYQM